VFWWYHNFGTNTITHESYSKYEVWDEILKDAVFT